MYWESVEELLSQVIAISLELTLIVCWFFYNLYTQVAFNTYMYIYMQTHL